MPDETPDLDINPRPRFTPWHGLTPAEAYMQGAADQRATTRYEREQSFARQQEQRQRALRHAQRVRT